MTPPQLARDAPGLDVFEPVEPGLLPGLGDDPDVAVLHRLQRGKRELGRIDIPLVGEPWLNDDSGAVAVRRRDDAILDVDQSAFLFEPGDDGLARLFPREAEQILRDEAVLRLHHESLSVEHVKHVGGLEPRALADLEVVEVVTGRDLHRAGAELGIGMLVGDDGNQAPGDRVFELLADQSAIALVLRMHRDRHVREHRLGPRGRDLDRAAVIGERVAERPELALDVLRLDLEVADRGLELGIPVHEALFAIDEVALVELDESVSDRALIALVHGEALVCPVAGGSEPPQLACDRAARLRLPFPHMLEESLPPNFRAVDPLAREIALHDHLRRDPCMVRPDDPQSVLAEHPLAAGEDVLQRVVERMPDVERAGDIRRRHHDRPRSRVGTLGPEQAAAFPMRVPAILDRLGVEGLGKVGHAEARLAMTSDYDNRSS